MKPLDMSHSTKTVISKLLKKFSAIIALILLLLMLELLNDPTWSQLRYDRDAVATGEWWRLVTAHFIHLGPWHSFLNASGLILVVLLAEDRASYWVWFFQLFLLAMGISLALYLLMPSLTWYVGMSGALHGLLVWTILPSALEGSRFSRLCLVLLVTKLIWEQLMGGSLAVAGIIGGPVVVEAHAFGALLGIVGYVLWRFFSSHPQSGAAS